MKKLIFTGMTVLALAFTAPAFGADGAEKKKKPERQQGSGAANERGEKLFAKIEEKLGRELTSEQKQQVMQTTRTTMQELKPQQEAFFQNLATAVKSTPEEVKAAIKPRRGEGKVKGEKGLDPESRICSALEDKLTRKLTDEEIAAVQGAIATRKSGVASIQASYVEAMVKITGLTNDQVLEILPKQLTA